MKALGLLAGLFLSMHVHAGLLGDDPPKEILDAQVVSAYGVNTMMPYGFTVRQFLTGYKDDKTRWEKDGQAWILHVDRFDKMAGTKVQIAVQFQALEGNQAAVTKMVVDKEYLSASVISNLLFTTQRGFIQAGVIKAPEITTSAPPKSKKSAASSKAGQQAKKMPIVAKTDEPQVPSPEELEKAREAEHLKALDAAMKSWAGTYANSQTDVGDTFSFASADGHIMASYKNPKCEFTEKAVTLGAESGDTLRGSLKEGDCVLSFTLRQSNEPASLSVDESGSVSSCKKICSMSNGSRPLTGRYVKQKS